MKALVYHGPGQRAWETKPKPTIRERGDAIVRITTSTICGTDLHILKGDVPSVTPGARSRTRGCGRDRGNRLERHVLSLRRPRAHLLHHRLRDLRLLPAAHAVPLPDRWLDFGEHDRRDSGRVRAHSSCRHELVQGARPILISRQWSCSVTSCRRRTECGVLNGEIKPGDTVAIVGAGPIGLAALLTAQLFSPSAILMIDLDGNRLRMAEGFGATSVRVNSGAEDAVARVLSITEGAGVDLAIEAVGTPAAFDTCQAIVGAGGRIANIGVHGKPVQLHLEKLWDRNIALTTRLVDTVTTPLLLKLMQNGRLSSCGTRHASIRSRRHHMQAYDTFADAAKASALKVVLKGRAGPISSTFK